jgi:formylglycine-generating enzyme required for sulfatase activity
MNDVLAEPFGWGVGKRYAFAQSIGERSDDGADATRLWSEAIAAIKTSPKYGDLEVVPQLGLLPIGMDPDSQLWEFAHLQTGDPAVRGADGKLVLTEETGLVFVLIPGGKFWMGAQNKSGAQNHDPLARSDEGPVHEVELSPYFLSKYEMTQGQWQRIAATNPSYYQPPGGLAPSLLHPVEQVSWPMCFDLLESLGLSLPSEAQWECGARGGTSTAWWTGQERESLRGKVNLADQTAKKAGASWQAIADWPDLEDGSVVHCAVGKYEANGFGLHEVAGNVFEWCLDGWDSGFYGKKSDKDPVSPWSGSSYRVYRGGSFINAASFARSAFRDLFHAPEFRSINLGLRPSRALRLSPSPLHPPK